MNRRVQLASMQVVSSNSRFWDIYLPLALPLIPASIFMMLGNANQGLDKPGVGISSLMIAIIAGLQIVGICSLAGVILIRFDIQRQKLHLRSNGNPAMWRKLALVTSTFFLLVYYIVTNVAAAFAGAGILLVLCIPSFAGYLVCKRVAFAGLF